MKFSCKHGRLSLPVVEGKGRHKKENKREKEKKREQVWLALLSDKPMSNGPPRTNLAKLSKPSSDDGKYYYCTIHIKTS